MADTFMNLAAGIMLLIGSLSALVAALGVLRFPDLYSRMHAASKAGVFGSGLILLALATISQDHSILLRALLAILFLLITTPISAHLLAKTAYLARYPMWKGSVCDEMSDSASWQDDSSKLSS